MRNTGNVDFDKATLQVAAVVVTFNRKQWLLECLNGLLNQTRPLQRIYIVDNCSSDGTEQALQAGGFLENTNVQYVRCSTNLGCSGGFAAGMKVAYNDGFDWLWLMDDDVEPLPHALQNLLPYASSSGCIHGRRLNADGSPTMWGELMWEHTVTTREIDDPLFLRSNFQRVTVGCFEGMLISRSVISKIGYPDDRFFIGWDDTYYGYLASRVTTVLYVNVFSLQRKREVESKSMRFLGRLVLLSPIYLKCSHRNRFLIAKALDVYRLPFWLTTARFVLRSILKELLIARSFTRAKAVLAGVVEGALTA